MCEKQRNFEAYFLMAGGQRPDEGQRLGLRFLFHGDGQLSIFGAGFNFCNIDIDSVEFSLHKRPTQRMGEYRRNPSSMRVLGESGFFIEFRSENDMNKLERLFEEEKELKHSVERVKAIGDVFAEQ